MTQSVIGALRVNLGLESAQFVTGVREASKLGQRLAKQLAGYGESMQSFGTKMSAAVTAPLAGLGALVAASTDSLATLANQAQLAGLSADRFKVLALAARGYGVEQDKMADILKDVDDKMGDFLQTGAGPMADFFEQIAPKVGVTADQFRDLNSADALQLYVSSLESANLSQSEMTFYLEALASDLTALAPMFADNGRAIQDMEKRARELGLSIDDGLIASARDIAAEFRIVRDVLSIQMQQALVRLAPAFSSLVTAIVPAVESVAQVITDLSERFAALPPSTQGMITGLAGLAALIGPVALGLGTMVVGVAGLVAPMAGLVGIIKGGLALAFGVLGTVIGAVGLPITLVAAGIGLLTAGVIKFWPEIKAGAQIIQSFISEQLERFSQWLVALQQDAAELGTALAELVSQGVDAAQRAFANAVDAVVQFKDDMIALGRQGVEFVKSSLRELVQDVINLPARLREVGSNLVSGLVEGVQSRWQSARSALQGIFSQVGSDAENTFEVRSPSRLFARIGGFLMEGLTEGVATGSSGPVGAVGAVADQMSEKFKGAADQINSSFENAFVGFVTGTMSARQAISGLLRDLARLAAQAAWRSLSRGLFGDSGIGGLLGGLFGGARAQGGPVVAGVPYLVNENTPRSEVMVPSQSGGVLNVPQAQAALRDMVPGGEPVAIRLMVTPSGDFDARVLQSSSSVAVEVVREYDLRLPERVNSILADPKAR